MQDTTAIIQQINKHVSEANKIGIAIAVTTTNSVLCALSIAPALNHAIDLNDEDAPFKLNELLKEVKAIAPKMRMYKAVFISRNRRAFNYQCEVQATNEDSAKIAARSELMAERLDIHNYKSPVISVIRNIQEAELSQGAA